MRHVGTVRRRLREDAASAGAEDGQINRPTQFSAASRPQADTMTRTGKARPHSTVRWPILAKRTHSAHTKSRRFYVQSTAKAALPARFEPFEEDHCKFLSMNHLRSKWRFPNRARSNPVKPGQTCFLCSPHCIPGRFGAFYSGKDGSSFGWPTARELATFAAA